AEIVAHLFLRKRHVCPRADQAVVLRATRHDHIGSLVHETPDRLDNSSGLACAGRRRVCRSRRSWILSPPWRTQRLLNDGVKRSCAQICKRDYCEWYWYLEVSLF